MLAVTLPIAAAMVILGLGTLGVAAGAETPGLAAGGIGEHTLLSKAGDSIGSILGDLQIEPAEAATIARLLKRQGVDDALKEGQTVRVLLAPSRLRERSHVVRVIVSAGPAIVGAAVSTHAEGYQAVAPDFADVGLAPTPERDEDDSSALRLYQAIYRMAARDRVPLSIIDDLTRTAFCAVDFQRAVEPGDAVELLYEDTASPAGISRPELEFAALSFGGVTKRFYRYRTPEDHASGFYDEAGRSTRTSMLCRPIVSGAMRRGFGLLQHPILGYFKMHAGVEWSVSDDPRVLATDDGTVEALDVAPGAGAIRVRLRHRQGYRTTYAGMTALADNILPGLHVSQGQVIGYAGVPLFSHVAPRLLYEVSVNERLIDPMRIALSPRRVLEGAARLAFERERARLEAAYTRNGRRHPLAQGE